MTMDEVNVKEKWFNTKQASEQTRVSIQTIINNIKNGRLKATELPNGNHGTKYLIAESDLIAWMEDRKSIKAVPNVKAKGTLAEYSYEEIAEELYRREKQAYERGIKEGVRQAKAEFMQALKGVKA